MKTRKISIAVLIMSLISIAVFYHAQYYTENKVVSSGVRDHAYAVLFLTALVLYFLLVVNIVLIIIAGIRLSKNQVLSVKKAYSFGNICINILSLFVLFLSSGLYFKMNNTSQP
jgi:uncharacterized membrane-anchored protein YitT (DUF2179 family)